MSISSLISWFGDIGLPDRPTVGGKGASLGELIRAGIRVPPGFVITTAAYREFLAATGMGDSVCATIESLQADDLQGIAAATREIREQIEQCDIPGSIQEPLTAAYQELCRQADGDSPVAIRSSATSEDSEEASFAGLQETFLWICNEPALLDSVRKCWASLYSPESVGYRLRLDLPEPDIAMGVVVQCMVDSRSSGVMFTRSPTTGDRSVIAIEGSWGLGSSIVSGEVTPDKYVISKVTGEISSRSVANKTVQHVPDLAAGGIRSQEVPDERQGAASISDEEINELVRIAKQVEQHYGSPQDIEWAIASQATFPANVYLLQSRPETVWAGQDRERQPLVTPGATAYDHVFNVLGRKK